MSAQDGNETTGMSVEQPNANKDENSNQSSGKQGGSFLDNRFNRISIYLVALFSFVYPAAIGWNYQVDEELNYCNPAYEDIDVEPISFYPIMCGLSTAAYNITA
eukprot:251971_1